MQHGLLSEYDAEAFQSQAQAAKIGFVEQMLLSKRMTATQIAMFASRACRVMPAAGDSNVLRIARAPRRRSSSVSSRSISRSAAYSMPSSISGNAAV